MKWEYCYATISGKAGMDKLNKLGQEGWELVSATVPLLGEYGAWLKCQIGTNSP